LAKLLLAILLVLIGIAIPAAWIFVGPALIIIIVVSVVQAVLSPVSQFLNRRLFTYDFQKSKEEIFDIILKVINENKYYIDSVDKLSGFIKFRTGASLSTTYGQEGTITVVPTGENACTVQINIGYKGQLWDWGEGKIIAEEIFNQVEEMA